MLSLYGLVSYASKYLRSHISSTQQPEQHTNLKENVTVYSMKTLPTHIRKMEQNEYGDKLFLIWFPRCNYDVERYTTQNGKVFYHITDVHPEFRSSLFLFRDHLHFSGIDDDCMVELTPTEEKFIGLDKILPMSENLADTKRTEENYIQPLSFNLSITDFAFDELL